MIDNLSLKTTNKNKQFSSVGKKKVKKWNKIEEKEEEIIKQIVSSKKKLSHATPQNLLSPQFSIIQGCIFINKISLTFLSGDNANGKVTPLSSIAKHAR